MGDHDLMAVSPEERASSTVWAAVCRCGTRLVRPSREQAEKAHTVHWSGAREALEAGLTSAVAGLDAPASPLVPYSGDVLHPMDPNAVDTEEGWRARERWYLRQIDQEWDNAEADLHDQPRTGR